MVAFIHLATASGGAVPYSMAITGLALATVGGTPRLYAITREGGLTAYALWPSGGMAATDRVALGAPLVAPSERTVEALRIDGALTLVAQGGGRAATVRLTEDSGFARPEIFRAEAGPALADPAADGRIRLYSAPDEGRGLTLTTLRPNGSLVEETTGRAGREAAVRDVTDLAEAWVGGRPFLLAASGGDHAVTSHRIASDGSLRTAGRIDAADGLGLDAPAALAAVQSGQGTYVITASNGSNALSVLRLWEDGSLSATDHILDTASTRFGAATVVETVRAGPFAYVLAGGGDDGLSLFQLLPDGMLLHLATVSDTAETALLDVSAVAARFADGTLYAYAASEEERGLSAFSVALGAPGLLRRGGAGDNALAGGDRGDLLMGGAGDDRLGGRAGRDILVDGPGDDRLTGGSGADIFLLDADGAPDRITDFTRGVDRLDLSRWPQLYSLDALDLTPTPGGARIRFRDERLVIDSADGNPLGQADLFPAGLTGPDRPPLVFSDPDLRIRGTNGDDTFQGAAGNDRIAGGSGADRLIGGAGADKIDGGSGPDRIDGGLGPDRIVAGDGADRAMGGDGSDRIEGGKGADTIGGGSGADVIRAGAGNDTVQGGSGSDRAYLGAGDDRYGDLRGGGKGARDTVAGGAGDDRIDGGGGDDRLMGEAGNDRLIGGAGDDRLEGGKGADRITGDAGADRITGGTGADILSGGAGADRFVFVEGFGRDRITDFRPGTDRLLFDGSLFQGTPSPERIIDRFAELGRDRLIFDFGAGDRLILDGVDRLRGLDDDIFLV